jgi:hypothetical protein
MTGPAPTGRRRRPRPLPAVPPARLIPADGHRARIGPGAIRAAYRAHTADTHQGEVGRGCRTCASYLAALARTTPTSPEEGQS